MTTVESFSASVDSDALADLRRRLRNVRWPDSETVRDWRQGVPLAYLKDVCAYWADTYDWGDALRRLDAIPNFRTSVDGLAFHFLHLKSPVQGAAPLILTNGWPSSVFEYLDVIPRLTDPARFGLSPELAFDVVVLSLPGYGLSEKPTTIGWGVDRIANAWHEIMSRLGYDRYFAHGSDWGAFVTTSLAVQHPDSVAGIHLTSAFVSVEESADMTGDEWAALDRMRRFHRESSGYAKQQSTRPQTLGYALADSPVGQCAWILEKFYAWTDSGFDMESPAGMRRLLDTVTLYWMTNSATSSARLYWESYRWVARDRRRVEVATAYTIFPEEITQPAECSLRERYTNLVYYHRADEGGHFPAMEKPEPFVAEIREAINALRTIA
jgi:pimeloyl-ACP methyl ester carboxylesterase